MVAKTFVTVVLIFCVSVPADSIDPTCVGDFLKRFKPSSPDAGLRYGNLSMLFPPNADDLEPSTSRTLSNLQNLTDSMLTRHHIIPRNTMRDFFIEALVNEEYQPRFIEFLRYMVNMSKKAGFDVPATIDDTLNSLQSMPAENIREFRRSVRELFAIVYWMPFNFFEGPMSSFRSDDPGEVMELNVQRVVNSQNIFANIVLLNGFMTDFIRNNGDKVGSTDQHNFATFKLQ